jgi:hypothetical protein
MVVVNGTNAKHGGVTYKFQTSENAKSFASCIEQGGKPDDCALKHNCIGKILPERDRGLGR